MPGGSDVPTAGTPLTSETQFEKTLLTGGTGGTDFVKELAIRERLIS
jgi:hypothetical protein